MQGKKGILYITGGLALSVVFLFGGNIVQNTTHLVLNPLNGGNEVRNNPPFKVGRPSKQERIFLIVFSYVKSGSSILGEIFEQYDDVFYIYESLHSVHGSTPKLRAAGLSMPNIRELDVTERKKKWVSDVLVGFFTCNIASVPERAINNLRTMGGRTRVLMRNCMKENSTKTCYTKFDSICKSKRLRATKLVRATMEDMEYFLSHNFMPDYKIKIIHNIRDPRGRFNSRMTTAESISHHCQRQMKDIKIRKELELRYPGTFLEMHYDDFAQRPFERAEVAYQFAFSQSVPESVKTFLKNATTGSERNGKYIRNSTATGTSWKRELKPQDRRIIERECKVLINHLEYGD